jgi:hypothetical protein
MHSDDFILTEIALYSIAEEIVIIIAMNRELHDGSHLEMNILHGINHLLITNRFGWRI